MKILVLSYILPPAGGAEKVAWDIACEYSKEHDVYMFVMGEYDHEIIKNNIKLFFFEEKTNSLKYYLTFGSKKIKTIVQKIKPDIIHAHAPTIFSYVLKSYKCKKIVTFHHSEKEHYNWSFFRRKKFEFFEKACVHNYERVTTVSKHMTNYFQTLYNKRIYTIPNGIDNNIFFNKKVKRKKNSIIYVGQLTKAKGVDKLLYLAHKMTNYSFILIGEGVLKNSVSLANVKFLGRKDSIEISKYLNQSEYAIFPSLYENFPLVGLEAMACGVITIARNNTGFNEYIINGHNGFLLESFTPRDLTSLLNYRSKEKIKQNAIKTTEDYSLEKIAKKYLSLVKF